jgi:hypothetical protein
MMNADGRWNRRTFLQVAAGSAAVLLAQSGHGANPQSARPSFLWISTEDINPDLGCYGDKYAKRVATTALERLQTKGGKIR